MTRVSHNSNDRVTTWCCVARVTTWCCVVWWCDSHHTWYCDSRGCHEWVSHVPWLPHIQYVTWPFRKGHVTWLLMNLSDYSTHTCHDTPWRRNTWHDSFIDDTWHDSHISDWLLHTHMPWHTMKARAKLAARCVIDETWHASSHISDMTSAYMCHDASHHEGAR